MDTMPQQTAHRVQPIREPFQGRTAASLEAARTPGWPGELRSPGLYAGAARTPGRPAGPAPETMAAADTERWLLLGLALLLFRSGCRTELVLALLYVAL